MPGKTRQESQDPLSAQAEMYDRTGRPVVCSQRASQTRFSREHKNVFLEEEENHDRTERLVVFPQRGAPQHFVVEDDEAESDLSLGSRSFLHRVNDHVRKRQKQSSMDATEYSEEHSVMWECSCLQHCKHLYSWGRITQTIGIPSRIQ